MGKFIKLLLIITNVKLSIQLPNDILSTDEFVKYKNHDIIYWQVVCESYEKEESNCGSKYTSNGKSAIDDYLPESCKNIDKIAFGKNKYKCALITDETDGENLKANKNIDGEDLINENTWMNEKDDIEFHYQGCSMVDVHKAICNKLSELLQQYKLYDPIIKEQIKSNYR